MLTYNTQLRLLPLPEYGRNIQNMVDYCVTIPDREERTRCAYSILSAMATLFPELKSQGGEQNHKLWDHLMIMSDFKLDIDFPCEVISKENLHTQPDKVDYSESKFRFRHYGLTIERMINEACAMEPGEQRDELVRLIANQMKKAMLESNGEGIDNSRIFADIAAMSHGEIRIDPEQMKLRDFVEPPKPTGKKKKKR
ncbi:MAG: DUF4290 domain-containing protein [Firmicutes bacterium]|nr:DUF4290 domain-containing protein [Bacillota bacterium]MCM1400830.1 DUF4290 domain-containing protein [Bacteroides sp.]MCM1476679.1 DUF4290 domain-containing protein [Bacteroides sp.]